MATRTLRRPPAPTTPALGVLPRRQLTGIGPAAVVLGLGAALVGMNIHLERGSSTVWIIVGTIIVAGLLVASGIRTFRRQGVLDAATEAVLPLLGAQHPSRDLVKATKWKDGWIGEPAKVVIRYAAFVDDDTDPRDGARGKKNFVDQIATNFSRRMTGEYRVTKHDQRKCVIVLELAPPTAPTAREVVRAEQVMKIIIGESAAVDVETNEQGDVIRVTGRHDQGPRMSFPARRMQAERVFSSMLPGRWRAKWDLETDTVVFEIRPPMPDMVWHESTPRTEKLTHAAYKDLRVPMGVDEDAKIQAWHPSVSPHCLVIGGTGSGKTSFQHTVLTYASAALCRVWVLDGKRIEFTGFRDWPNVELVAARVEHQVRMLHAAHELMERRYTQLENGTARLEDFDALILIIDEYATFKARVMRWYQTVKPKGAPAKPPVLDLLPDLARLARSAKIHILLGIQRPDAEFLGGEMRDNFGARISLGRLSPQGAMMMWDSPAIGVALPRNKRGRGVTLNHDSLPVEVQTYYTPDPAKLDASDEEDWKHLNALKPQVVTYPRRMILDPEPLIIGEEEVEADYFAWASARIVEWDGSQDTAEVDEVDDYEPPRELPSNVVALGARRRPVPAAIRFEPSDDEEDTVVDDPGTDHDGYGDLKEGGVEHLEPGDLLLVDEELELWAVVETIEPDVLDDDAFAVEFRDLETGDSSMRTFNDTDVIAYRSPVLDQKGQ